jgi:outer membrane protein
VRSRVAQYALLLSWLPVAVAAQPIEPPRGERLSLDAAVALALAHNPSLEIAALDVEKAEAQIGIAKTRRLPSFETTVGASQLLTPVSFDFPAGAFGEIPGVGPFPATDTTVKSDQKPVFFVTGQVLQPITQLGRLGLGVKAAIASREVERERIRERQLAVVASVRRLYFAMLQTESALSLSAEVMAHYRELGRAVAQRVVQKVALRADALDVEARLAQEEVTALAHRHTLASQKEQMNQLLGRDVRTPFELDRALAASLASVDMTAAQARALDSRPDVRQARLAIEQADLDRRIKHGERIPDVSVAVSYSSNFNVDVMPRNLASFGVQLKWEPFDWGRRSQELSVKSHTLAQARRALRDAEDRAIVEVNARFRKLAEARAQLAVAELAQQTARERLRVTTNQYELQTALLTDVLARRAALSDTNDRYQQALLAMWTARADFDQAVGEDVIK